MNSPLVVSRIVAIGQDTEIGRCDPLVACRAVAALLPQLEGVPATLVDFFVGIASETDDLPLGSVRQEWARDALAERDAEAAKYRERIGPLIVDRLQQLIAHVVRADQAGNLH